VKVDLRSALILTEEEQDIPNALTPSLASTHPHASNTAAVTAIQPFRLPAGYVERAIDGVPSVCQARWIIAACNLKPTVSLRKHVMWYESSRHSFIALAVVPTFLQGVWKICSQYYQKYTFWVRLDMFVCSVAVATHCATFQCFNCSSLRAEKPQIQNQPLNDLKLTNYCWW